MKRFWLLVLTVACLLACFTVWAAAEGTDSGVQEAGAEVSDAPNAPDTPNASDSSDTGSQGDTYSVKDLTLKFCGKVAEAFWRLRGYYDAAVGHFGGFARYMPVVLAALLLIFCFFGYRLFRVETVLIGAVTGYAIAFATYEFLLAWKDHWAFLEDWENVLRWVLVAIFAILGMFVGRLLRRVGVSLVVGLLSAAYFAGYSSNVWVLAAVFVIVMLICIVAVKPVVIFVTGVIGSVAVVKLLSTFLFGAEGFYPMDINAKLGVSPELNVVLICGLLLGLLCAWVQARTGRGRRYY